MLQSHLRQPDSPTPPDIETNPPSPPPDDNPAFIDIDPPDEIPEPSPAEIKTDPPVLNDPTPPDKLKSPPTAPEPPDNDRTPPVLSKPCANDDPAVSVIAAPEVDIPAPELNDIEPAEPTLLEPLPKLNEPLEDTDEEPLNIDTDPGLSKELERDNKPPDPLEIITEPPGCPAELIPPSNDTDPPTKPEPEAIFTDPPAPDEVEEEIDPATTDTSPANTFEPFEAPADETCDEPSRSPVDNNIDPLDSDEVLPVDIVTEPEPEPISD